MGFYGHITNVQRTSMSFDRFYPNRYTMDQNAKNDGVYAGRYVLVEYDRPTDKAFLPRVIQFDGILYAPPPINKSFDPDVSDITSPLSYYYKLEPFVAETENQELENQNVLNPDQIVVCSSGDNLGLVEDNNGEIKIRSVSRAQYFRIGSGNNSPRLTLNLLYNYKTKQFEVDTAYSQELKVCCSYLDVDYADVTLADSANHFINFNIDASNYTVSRGYDSTVWQKTYVNSVAKYVMIAELNSVVPIIDVTADAPTLAPIMPHFDKDSTNIYYKLHMQPSWGFRIKAKNGAQKIPTLDYSGSTISDYSAQDINASLDTTNYPSDSTTQWINTVYQDNNYVNKYLGNDGWQSEEANIESAIYFNKAGFAKSISTHNFSVKDKISLTPTGFSGHLYPTHTTDGRNVAQPDVNELAIMLPSLGNAVADMWDLIYGNGVGNEGNRRNTAIKWEKAKNILTKEGLRLVKTSDELIGYTYNTDEVNTLAGVINSAQDILGMIISDYPTQDNIEKLNENYIYYDSTTGKYYYKKRSYQYNLIDDDDQLSAVALHDWNDYKDSYWWVDTNNKIASDYIREDIYHPDRKYVTGVNVPPEMPREAGEEEDANQYFKIFSINQQAYEAGRYYIFKQYDDYTMPKTQFKDVITQTPYVKYIKSNGSFNYFETYFDIIENPIQLSQEDVYYIPNKYYAGTFTLFNPIIANEDELVNKLSSGVRIFKPKNLSTVQNSEYGFYAEDAEEITSIEDYEDFISNFADVEDGNRLLRYLTLSTCNLTVDDFATRKQLHKQPMLFSVPSVTNSPNLPQNYYVLSEKYELLNNYSDWSDHSWIANVTAAPGLYYYIEQGEDQKANYINVEQGYVLKSDKVNELYLEQDVDINENYMYFRKVVSMILTVPTNIVDIKNAIIITPTRDSFPDNLYQKYINGDEVGYRSISATSDIVVGANDYSSIQDLCELTISKLKPGYNTDKYYYVTLDEEQSIERLVLENGVRPVPGRRYWTKNMVNKKQISHQEHTDDLIYYLPNLQMKEYDRIGQNAVNHNSDDYYVSSLEELTDQIYYPGKYYYKNASDGSYILDESPDFTSGRQYYENPQRYIIEDPTGSYSVGAAWPLDENPPEDSGIKLAYREESWELKELEGFSLNFNTLYGLILRLNQMLLQGDIYTRDENTLQGILNKTNDLIHRFSEMAPSQLIVVNDLGQMQGASCVSEQTFSAYNWAKGQTSTAENVIDNAENVDGDGRWININVSPTYHGPSLTIKHNFNKIQDTTSIKDLNALNSDTVDLYSPIVDNVGHIVGHNVETVNLPNAYQTFKDSHSTLGTSKAVNTHDSFSFEGDAWINPTVTSGKLSITHSFNEVEDMTSEVDCNNPVSDTIELDIPQVDLTGHIVGKNTRIIKLPNAYSTFVVGNNSQSADTTHSTLVFSGDEWISLVLDNQSSELKLAHANPYKAESFNPTALGGFSNQTPDFGESFQIRTYSLDGNGHVINSSDSTITLPDNIWALTLSNTYTPHVVNSQIVGGQSLLKILQDLDTATLNLNTDVSGLNSSVSSLNDAVTELETTLSSKAPVEGNINQDTTFTYLEEGNLITVSGLVQKVGEIETDAVTNSTSFLYSTAVEEQSHVATEEDVLNGIATEIGEVVTDQEAIPEIRVTIQDLIQKIKLLEQTLNG